MPCKNAGHYLDECLQSILDQSIDHWELILVDDHSTDNSSSIAKSFSDRDPRIKTLANSGKGIIDALQHGYQYAQGKYITRMDADDRMSNDKLELLQSALLSDPKSNVSTGFVSYFSEQPLGEGYKKYTNWLNELTATETNFSDIYKECVIASPCWMMQKSDFDKIGGFNNNIYPEDYDLCFRMYQHKLKIVGVQQVLHHWRDYATRSSRTDPNYQDNSFLELKINYFIRIDLDHKQELVLWGAGKKAKKVAQILAKNSVSFLWVCNNENKIGKQIYQNIVEDCNALILHKKLQILILVANPDEQVAIIKRLKNRDLTKNKNYFLLC